MSKILFLLFQIFDLFVVDQSFHLGNSIEFDGIKIGVTVNAHADLINNDNQKKKHQSFD